MVKFIYQPPKEIVILECTQYSLEHFAQNVVTIIKAGQPYILMWAEGVVFTRFPIPPTTERLMDEYLDGRTYLSGVIFALMSEYKPSIRVGTIDIPVVNVSPSELHRQMAKWLKDQAKEL